jgi:hypothetical protein
MCEGGTRDFEPVVKSQNCGKDREAMPAVLSETRKEYLHRSLRQLFKVLLVVLDYF